MQFLLVLLPENILLMYRPDNILLILKCFNKERVWYDILSLNIRETHVENIALL